MRHHTHYLRHITDWFEWLKNPKFGDIAGGNYSEFETDGSLVMKGDATVWDDLRFPASAQDKSGSPTLVSYKSGQVLTLASNVNQGIFFNAQLPHGYMFGGDLDLHVHYVLPTAGAGAGVENVKFDATVCVADINGTFGTPQNLTVTVDVQNLAADTHYLVDLGSITNSIAGVSAMMIRSLERDVSVANDYSSSVYLLEADFHYEIDSLGSREEYVK